MFLEISQLQYTPCQNRIDYYLKVLFNRQEFDKMVFGRKKQEQEVVEDGAANQDTDLAVAYGNGDEVDDDLSLTDSVPPPPPAGKMNSTKSGDLSQDDSPTESPSADGSVDEKKEAAQIKRKKLLLIAGCIISFFVLLGLAIKYGQIRNQSAANESLTVGLESESLESPPVETTPVETTPSETLAPIILVNETAAPSANVSEVGTVEYIPFSECVANEISVLSTTCTDANVARATVLFNFCLVDDLADQFWEFIRTPRRLPQRIANNWKWLRAGEVAEISSLLEGEYEIGLFSNGEEQLQEYPLLNSTTFIVDCSQE